MYKCLSRNRERGKRGSLPDQQACRGTSRPGLRSSRLRALDDRGGLHSSSRETYHFRSCSLENITRGSDSAEPSRRASLDQAFVLFATRRVDTGASASCPFSPDWPAGRPRRHRVVPRDPASHQEGQTEARLPRGAERRSGVRGGGCS